MLDTIRHYKHKLFPLQRSVQNVFSKRSYSQSGEDMIVSFILMCIGEVRNYIDIGAHHPFEMSNTAYFYEKGYRGVNVEPNPELFKFFVEHRNRDINLNCGVHKESGELDFYLLNPSTLSSFDSRFAEDLVERKLAQLVVKRKIPVIGLDALYPYFNKGLDFLSLDVEGLDMKIMQSWDFNFITPKVICCETISYGLTGHAQKNIELINFIQSKGYFVYADTYINTIFVHEKSWLNRK